MSYLTQPIVIVTIIVAAVTAVLGLLPGFIVSRRRVAKQSAIRTLGLCGFAGAGIGFSIALAATLLLRMWRGANEDEMTAIELVLGTVPGGLAWIIALGWAVFGKPESDGNGFEVQPIRLRVHSFHHTSQ